MACDTRNDRLLGLLCSGSALILQLLGQRAHLHDAPHAHNAGHLPAQGDRLPVRASVRHRLSLNNSYVHLLLT